MKKSTSFLYLTTFVLLLIVLSCSKKGKQDIAEKALDVRSDKKTIQKLEEFLNIPVYPGANLADIFTERRDDKIPEERMDCRVSLIIDDYDKVPQFYEKELGWKFVVDVEN